jgi:hypothetical protein
MAALKRRKKRKQKSPVPSAPLLPRGGPIPDKALFRPDEAAALAGLSKRTIYRWLRKGILQGEHRALNGPSRVPWAAVVDLVKKVGAGAPGPEG